MDVPSGHLDAPTPAARLSRSVTLVVALLVCGAALISAGCGDEQQPQPPSLETPTAMTTATRASCGSATPVLDRFGDGRCALGLIANADKGSVAVTNIARRKPRLTDLDPTVPGFTHIDAGRRPIDIAASPDGTAAYTLDSVRGNLSVIDLWRLRTLETTIPVDGQPAALATAPGEAAGGQIAVITTDPDALWLRDGVHCDQSADGDPCSGLEAESTQIPLPGRPAALDVSADGSLAYIVYGNRDFMSVVALPGNDQVLEQDEYTCRGGRTGAPCEAVRIGLSYGCSDGVDSDGDGQIDREDPQCWGPTDAESPGGIGRRYTGVCADGEDNDNDGALDRVDPECQISAGDSETKKTNPDAVFTCSDGEDNDGDDLTDYPDDPDCYGATGQRESAVETSGFGAIGVDQTGTFVYVVDGANNQVLTVDAQRGQLIDAARTTPPHGAPFTQKLGIPVASRPTGATGFVSRDVAWTDPEDSSHGIIQYTFGTYVVSNNGRVYTLRTVSSDCEVRETDRDSLLSQKQFRRRGEAFRSSNERHCLQTPPFPLPKGENGMGMTGDGPCKAARMCLDCQKNKPQGMGDVCSEACANFEKNSRQCRRIQGRRLSPTDNVNLVVNPHFAPIDSEQPQGRLRGAGTCSEPRAFIERMRSYSSENEGASREFGCASSLRDQPIERFASDLEGQDSFENFSRANLLQFTSLQLSPPDEDNSKVHAQTVERPYDFRYRDEQWTVTWEGVLPGTDRQDGLLAKENAGQLLTEPLDLCKAGVRAGDRVIIKNSPETGSETPDRCGNLVPDGNREGGNGVPDSDDPFLTYRVDEVRPNSIKLSTMDSERFAQTLPSRGCFPSAIRYEIRPEDEWTVVGNQSGFQSRRTSSLGQCVPKFGADNPRIQGRVASDEVFVGPYLEFLLYDGPVSPIRRQGDPYSYTFATQRFFSSQRFRSEAILPSDILLTPEFDGGRKLMVSDASNDFVWIRNLTHTGDESIRLQ
ncbi:MAG: hypothetical protein ABEK29_10620 [Bradymonadaceae bacterium]